MGVRNDYIIDIHYVCIHLLKHKSVAIDSEKIVVCSMDKYHKQRPCFFLFPQILFVFDEKFVYGFIKFYYLSPLFDNKCVNEY